MTGNDSFGQSEASIILLKFLYKVYSLIISKFFKFYYFYEFAILKRKNGDSNKTNLFLLHLFLY